MPYITLPRWVIVVGALIVLLGAAALLVSLVVGYIGDEYVSPPFDESSVPPARR